MNSRLILLLFVAFFLIPTVASANAGTTLMWAEALHLLFGNSLIGSGEGLFLAMLFRLNKLFCIAVMIAANYFSAWVGYAWLTSNISQSLNMDLYNVWRWMWIMVGVSYLITLGLEWPFIAFCLRKKERWFRKSLWGTLATQTISYALIVGWYWPVSGMELYQKFEIVQPSQMTIPCELRLVYISETDGDVYSMDLNYREAKRIATLKSRNPDDMLFLEKSSANEKQSWDLMAITFQSQSQTVMLLPVFTDKGYMEDPLCKRKSDGSWWNFGKVPRLEGTEQSDWEFECGFWAVEGLRGINKKDQRTIHLCLETPFIEWYVRDAVELSTGQVIFQFGEKQICLFDPEEKKITLLAKGHGPIVTTKKLSQ
jgi:hypothetical protein